MDATPTLVKMDVSNGKLHPLQKATCAYDGSLNDQGNKVNRMMHMAVANSTSATSPAINLSNMRRVNVVAVV